MRKNLNAIRRRDFLTGAVTAIGAGVVGVVPSFAAAQAGVATNAGLYFWNGAAFISAADVNSPAVASESVCVRIEAFGASPNMAAIDVEMAGGLFHAFTSPPRGGRVSQFRAPVELPRGLTFIVRSGSGASAFALGAGSSSEAPIVLALGTYLLVDPGVKSSQFSLTSSSTAPLIYSDGLPVSIPHILVTIGD